MNLKASFEELLTKHNYVVNYDKDDDLFFNYDGVNYVIIFENNDPSFVTILTSSLWKIDDFNELLLAQLATNEVNKSIKGAFANIHGEEDNYVVRFLSEIFLEKPFESLDTLLRYITEIQAATTLFSDLMQKLESGEYDDNHSMI